MLRTFQKIVNAYHNARLDASQIILAPVMLRKITGGQQKSLKVRPGAILPVQSPGDIQLLQKGAEGFNILAGLLQEEQVNQRLAETYVGVFDAAITNLQDSKERRTAAEINAIQSLSGNIFGLDAKIFQVALSRSLTKIWQLYQDFGPEEMFFRVTGEEQPRIATKREIARNYDIRAAGTPANTNRAIMTQSLERIMQVLMSNPIALQSGQFDLGVLMQRWLQTVDSNLAREIIRPAEQSAAVQTINNAANILDPNGGGLI